MFSLLDDVTVVAGDFISGEVFIEGFYRINVTAYVCLYVYVWILSYMFIKTILVWKVYVE